MLAKEARKPSPDPIQEKIRQNKANWNKDVSAFVNDLIHFKKMMNGWPSKFFKERSRIIDPIPADPSTIIGSLASDFQEITQRGQTIIQAQLNYSKNRKQKQPKTSISPATDLSKQLAAFEHKYSLITEASNPMSRFWAKLTTPTMGFGQSARIRRLRMTLLNAAIKTYKELGKLQTEIVKSSSASISNAHKIMTMVWNHWSIVARSFNSYKTSIPTTAELPNKKDDKDEEISPEIKEQLDQDLNQKDIDINPILQDLRSVIASNKFVDDNTFLPIFELMGKYYGATNSEKAILAPKLMEEYRKLLQSLNAKYHTNATTLKDIHITNASATEQLQALSQAFLRKWLGKTRHQLLPGHTSGSRIEIFEAITVVRSDINSLMDNLEKGLEVELLNTLIPQITRGISNLRSMLRSLHYSEKPTEAPPLAMF